jgi:hypothetical protein
MNAGMKRKLSFLHTRVPKQAFGNEEKKKVCLGLIASSDHMEERLVLDSGGHGTDRRRKLLAKVMTGLPVWLHRLATAQRKSK